MKRFAAGLVVLFITALPVTAQEDLPTKIPGSDEWETLGSYQDYIAFAYTDRFDESSGNGAATFSGKEQLMVLCFEGGQDIVYVRITEYLGSQDGVLRRVLYQFDDGDVHESKWIQFDAGVPGSLIGLSWENPFTLRDFDRFVRKAKTAGRVYLRVYDFENDPSDHEFSLMGFSAAYEMACGR